MQKKKKSEPAQNEISQLTGAADFQNCQGNPRKNN